MARALAALVAAAAAACLASAAAPIPGFRPPAVPLFSQSPEINLWSTTDTLYGGKPSHWTGAPLDFAAAVSVDGKAYLLMGDAGSPWVGGAAVPTATQTGVTVFSTQTVYSFTAGGVVALNMTFTTPLLTDDWELLSTPAHYVTFDVAATDGSSHDVSFYFDASATIVMREDTALASWQRLQLNGVGIAPGSVTALQIGATNQNPLADTNDRPGWGYVYLLADTSSTATGASMVLEYSNTTRSQFFATGSIPSSDNTAQPAPLLPPGPPAPPTGPQKGIDRSGSDMPGSPFTLPSADPLLCWAECNKTAGCDAWAYAIPGCDTYPQPTCWLKNAFPATSPQACRISGAQAQPTSAGGPLVAAAVFSISGVTSAGASRRLTFAVDEILTLEWFGEACPPYWRRDLPVGNTSVIPVDMLARAHVSYPAVRAACTVFDAQQAALLSGVGGDEYSTVTQLVYRQALGQMALVWVPSKADVWYFLKEASSCGCLNTADVVYPAQPILTYLAPELLRRMIISHLEYAMNYTNQPYPLPWSPHHLGYWPIADLPYDRQENMPLEETAWQLLTIASIAQRQGGDLSWLEPYWPAVQEWAQFLITLLPFPQEQLSTDDFDGPLYNATNLAMKGIASIAAWGYIQQQYTGNTTAAQESYALAATYAGTMVDYAWLSNGTTNSHFMIGYKGSQADGGDPNSWPMLYNALWLRVFGYDNLLPNQAQLLQQQGDWYAANQMHEYGLPLNSRKTFTKDDWQTFLAATYYTSPTTPGATPQPSAFSTTLFNKLYAFANATTSRVPLSDWTNTDEPTAVGFQARPVYGAMYAPVLVAQGPQLGLGHPEDPATKLARETFARVHAEREQRQARAGAA